MGSIPLPALSVQPPPDPTAGIQRLIALKGMLQGQQIQSQQLALDQQKVTDQKSVMSYMQQNPNSTFADAASDLKGKISLPTYTSLLDTDATIRQKHAAATDSELKNFNAVHDAQKQIYDNVAGLSDADLAKQWPAISSQFNSIPGNNAKVDPNTPLTQAQLQQHGTALGLQEAYLKQEQDKRKEVAETTEAAAKGTEATASAAAKTQEALWYKQHPEAGAPGVPTETASAADWMAKNPGKTLSDYNIAMKKIVPAFNFSLLSNTGVGKPSADVAQQFGMSPTAFDQAAEKYWTSGALPPAGRGGPALAMNKALMNRAAELHPEGSLAANSAEYKANSASLTKLQSNLDQVSAFENTAIKNLDMFTGLAQKAIDTGVPLVNAPLRSAAGLLGSKDQASFEAARQVAVNEIAKVTSSPGLTGQLSDTARKEVASFIPASATVGQIMSLAGTLKQDMANRHQSYQDQIGDIQKRIRGGGGGDTVSVQIPGHPPGTIPRSALTQFQKDHPDATVQK
jgi:hypothetical protein